MKAGTIVRMPDGSLGTVVYNGLDGVGIKWGRYQITQEDLEGNGGLFNEEISPGYEWYPEAMLREPYKGSDLPCVGEDYEIVK